jgi:hypothetical protein
MYLSIKEGSLFVMLTLMEAIEQGCFKVCFWNLWKATEEEGGWGAFGFNPWHLDLRCKSS